MSKLLINKYNNLTPYTPGEQPSDKRYVKLNTNESPYPPSRATMSALRSARPLNLYSDPECVHLRSVLAQRYGVAPENVFASNGSDEILSFSFMAFCGDETAAVFPDITYGFYKVFGELYGVDYMQAPLNDDFTVNIDDYINVSKTVVIANPNAPTGLLLSVNDIEKIVVSNPHNVVIIDEAYIDFAGEKSSCIELTCKYDNLLVVRTFSKSRSLAGARLGFAIGSVGIINVLNTIKYSTNPYNVNTLTQAAGAAAIADDEYYMDCAAKIVTEREHMKCALRERGFKVTDSKANFLFAKPCFISGEEYYLKLKEMGILVRWFSTPRIRDYVRVTVGTPEQTGRLLEATDILREKVCG